MPLPRVLRPPAAERGAAGRAATKKKGAPAEAPKSGRGALPGQGMAGIAPRPAAAYVSRSSCPLSARANSLLF